MANIAFTFTEAASLLEKLRNSCREWRELSSLECIADELLHTLLDVRVLVNAQCPVNRLPVEILSKIFHQVPPLLTPDLHYRSLEELLVWESLFEFKDTNALLPLTHVCRQWRDVALDTPTLWTTIYGSSHPRAVDEYHFRSRSAPLRALNVREAKYCDVEDEISDVEDENLGVEKLWRTDGQHIQSFASYPGGWGLDLPTSCAHELQALAAWDCQLRGDVSNFKVFVLRAVDWHLPSSLTNLTHLFLSRKRLHIVDFFRMLSIAPRLEDLGLYDISAKDAPDPHRNIPAVTLQHLRRLSICRSNRNIVSGFFSHVGLPAHLAVNFESCQVSDFQWLVPLAPNDAEALYISSHPYSVFVAGLSKAIRLNCDNDLGVMIQWITIKIAGDNRPRSGGRHSTFSQDLKKIKRDLKTIQSHVGVVWLIEDDPIALPLPDVCTDGVPSPYFWPKKWSELYSRVGNVMSCMVCRDGGEATHEHGANSLVTDAQFDHTTAVERGLRKLQSEMDILSSLFAHYVEPC
ncbi:hypothetical protein POSPLADRAFT_1145588 [Postia placenta MAD-698-R-SB12]|uniref:F-box domain-containing protein n=1 Tax=Postia placenta MAD-698-R-SB12 TaxID=670580 RepID=A0A1X6MZH9_9APHY|nr:hypothetical protein POSPLADRAFT_1145588 [Postia placenta MAD-698-R-SB12]OSX61778.1 hypothetical protein POSPLADRAFT_1145588 [Postia placenta MAD-698-R-SB12]